MPDTKEDQFMSMLGVGKQLWEREPGDRFIERLRSEDAQPPPSGAQPIASAQNVPESVWQRIVSHQGEGFETVRGLPFRYEVDGNGIWFFRDGRRINRRLTRTQV